MKTFCFVAGLMVMLYGETLACSSCGGSAALGFSGILPHLNQHSVGLKWSHSRYDNHFQQTEANASVEEYYNNLELAGRFYLTQRLQLNIALPYAINNRYYNGRHSEMSGIADSRLLLKYDIFNTADSLGKNVKHLLSAGAGVKIPTSRIDGDDYTGTFTFQPGSKTFDLLFAADHTMKYRQAGISSAFNYQLNTRDRDDTRYGNRFSAGSALFYWFKAGKLAVIPLLGAQFEHSTATQHDGMAIGESKAWFANAGIDLMFWQMHLSALYQRPFRGDYVVSEMYIGDRFTLSLNYIF